MNETSCLLFQQWWPFIRVVSFFIHSKNASRQKSPVQVTKRARTKCGLIKRRAMWSFGRWHNDSVRLKMRRNTSTFPWDWKGNKSRAFQCEWRHPFDFTVPGNFCASSAMNSLSPYWPTNYWNAIETLGCNALEMHCNGCNALENCNGCNALEMHWNRWTQLYSGWAKIPLTPSLLRFH